MASHRRALLAALLAGALTGACASAPRQAGVVPVPRPFPGGPVPGAVAKPDGQPLPAPASPGAAAAAPGTYAPYALAGTALEYRGTPYRNGGTDPQAGFDCSGFTQFVFAQYGVWLPREVADQFRMGTSVKPKDLQPGDLIFFSTISKGASHVAIAIGGDQFVHAPSSNGVVRVERLNSSYWGPRFVGARRVSAN
jgi:cell wall-associated NlpC family hydrolase